MKISQFKYPKIILSALMGQIGDFFLAGGTALAMYYFQHRESKDVDLFTQKYSILEIDRIVEHLLKILKGSNLELGVRALIKAIDNLFFYYILY